jgi:hypothetical protein
MAKRVTARIKESVAETVDRATHLDVAGATQAIAKKFGLNQRLINYTHIELRNKLNEYGFKSTPYNERILFLPHCLRNSRDCKAESTAEGLRCKRCGKCDIAALLAIADELGYASAYVVPGGSMMQKIIRKEKPKATFGVEGNRDSPAGGPFDAGRLQGHKGKRCRGKGKNGAD